MTPKEKSEELFNKYMKFDFNTIVNSTQREYAKKCTLIVVEEILEESFPDKGFYFWKCVKEELEKI